MIATPTRHKPPAMDACTGKVRYAGRHSAEMAKRISNRCGTGDRFGAYLCDYCHYWHVGHVDRFKRRKKAS